MTVTGAKRTIYVGTFIHSVSLTQLEVLKTSAVAVDDESGKIVAVEHPVSAGKLEAWAKEEGTKIIEAGPGQFFFPGLIDTHIHASQYPNNGIFGKSTLLDWLNTYTFPLESSLSSPTKAHRVYTRCVARTLSHGTTTAAYYATRDPGSTNILASTCHRMGQRAFVGRCAMDRMAPSYYVDADVATSLADTRSCADFCKKLDPKGLVQSIITPRFAPSCTRELLTGLGEFMEESGLRCQTHVSENKGEVQLVADLFPECSSYTDVYDRYGLLGERTVLAHAVHLSDEELGLVKRSGTKISHCPVSNAALASGAARVRRLLREGVVVGLGTDVSGGYSPSILEAARQAALTSRLVAVSEDEESLAIGVDEVLYLATRGGAEVLGLEDKVGGFEVGMEWDAVLVGCAMVPEIEGCGGDIEDEAVGGSMGPVDLFGWENWEETVAKWVYSGDDRNVLKVWVRGMLVHEKPV